MDEPIRNNPESAVEKLVREALEPGERVLARHHYRKKRQYYRIKGPIKRWEGNFWRIPADESGEEFVRAVKRIAGLK